MNHASVGRENKAKQSQFSFTQSRVRCALVSAAVRQGARIGTWRGRLYFQAFRHTRGRGTHSRRYTSVPGVKKSAQGVDSFSDA